MINSVWSSHLVSNKTSIVSNPISVSEKTNIWNPVKSVKYRIISLVSAIGPNALPSDMADS